MPRSLELLPSGIALFLRQCDNRCMRKALIAVTTILIAGAVLLGSSVAQSTGKSQTAPAKKQSTAPAKNPSPAASPTPASKAEAASAFANQKDKGSYALGDH